MEVFLQHQHLVKVQPEWWHELTEKIKINKKATEDLALDVSVPLNYYAVFQTLQSMMPKDAIIVSEGANTMVTSLLRNKRFLLKFLPWQIAPKFAIFYIYENLKLLFPLFISCYFIFSLMNALVYVDQGIH